MTHQNYNYFFIDECGYSLNTTRRVARSEKGQKAVVLEARNKGRNTSVVACANKDLSLVPYEYKDGSINTNDFISFLNVMLSTVYDLNIPNPVIILDIASINRKADVDQWCNETGWDYIFFPPIPQC